jgi:hypothetical protein
MAIRRLARLIDGSYQFLTDALISAPRPVRVHTREHEGRRYPIVASRRGRRARSHARPQPAEPAAGAVEPDATGRAVDQVVVRIAELVSDARRP